MATIRTEAQLEAFFADNNTGDISALDGRDFVATFFGLATTTDPGPNNDSQDTAGIGAFFSAGSRWLNVNTQIEWVCFDGTPGLAVWRHPSYFGDTPTIVTAGTGIAVAFSAPSTYEVSATGSGGVTVYNAVVAILEGTPLSGLAPISGYTPVAGDRILTWDQVDRKTSGIWIASAGLWTRATDFPAGLTVNGVAFVWVSGLLGDFSVSPALCTIAPEQVPTPVNPFPWVVGTDFVVIAWATPTPVVGGVPPIAVSFGVNVDGGISVVVSLTGTVSPSNLPPLNTQAVSSGPLNTSNLFGIVPSAQLPSLNSQAGVNGPLSAPNVGPGTFPALVLLPPSQLDTGTIASGVLLPPSQLDTGTVSPGVDVPWTQVTGAPAIPVTLAQIYNPFSYGTTPTAVFTFTASVAIQGTVSAENLSGSGTARLQFDTVDPRNGSQSHFVGIGGPGSWSGVVQIPEGLAALGFVVGNFTSVTVSINGNGTAGTAKVTAALTAS